MPPLECTHTKLTFSPSSHALEVGYKRAILLQRVAATTSQVIRSTSITDREHASTFPAPLVLPEDELSWDPTYPPQSVRSWIRLKERNIVTAQRGVVYVVGPPTFEPEAQFAEKWAEPNSIQGTKDKPVSFPKTEEVLNYLQAFYHGLPVQMLQSSNLCFMADIPEPKSKNRKGSKAAGKSPTLFLNTNSPAGAIGIRTRATPNGAFTHQLNLTDLLDAVIDILPSDAYALLMIVKHDIYEDEDDDFACGRAYGGSRIAVVSGARYNPTLDEVQEVEREHAWPASHCETYVQNCCEKEGEEGRKSKKTKLRKEKENAVQRTPMHAALTAHLSLPPLERASSPAALSGLWLGRVCRTAGHELGHCFGIDHCVYYACSMQGTASIIEDARQPPYLCPVDLAKILKATGGGEKERYHALLTFCDKHKDAHVFAAFGAWIRGRLET